MEVAEVGASEFYRGGAIPGLRITRIHGTPASADHGFRLVVDEYIAGAIRRSFWPWDSQGGRALGLGRMRRPRRLIYTLAAKAGHGYEERDSRRVTRNRIRAGELRFFCCADGGGDFVAADLGKGMSPTGRAHVPVSVEAGRAGPRGRRKVLLGCAVKNP
jgi:hypothetical protein